MINLLGNTKSNIFKSENGENVLYSKISEVVLVHCNIVNNDYQKDWIVLHIFVLNRSYGQLIDI